jgi:WD40 repeat protein
MLVWDVASGGLSVPPLEGHRAGVHAAFFSPDGQTLQTMADDRRIKLWCLATGQEMLSRRRGPLWLPVPLFSSDGSIFFDNEEGGSQLKFTRLQSLAEIDAEEKAKGQLH